MTTFTREQAAEIAAQVGIDFAQVPFDLDQFTLGVNVELEHGSRSPETNVTNDDPVTTGRIALAHLREIPDYYTRLAEMERAADA